MRDATGDDKTAIFRAGVHLLGERWGDQLLVGGGPHASAALGYELSRRALSDGTVIGNILNGRRTEPLLLTVGPTFDLDVRFTRGGTTACVGLAVGLAWATGDFD